MSFPRLDEHVSVAPQILPDVLPDLVANGVTTVICNRPDAEVPPEASSEALRAACEAAGVAFHYNPLAPGGLSLDVIATQAEAIAGSDGQVLAYCASGTRSAILWAFASTQNQTHAPDAIEKALDQAGYAFPGVVQQLEGFAAQLR